MKYKKCALALAALFSMAPAGCKYNHFNTGNQVIVGISSQNDGSELGAAQAYFDAVISAGGRPVPVRLTADERRIRRAVSRLDALVLTGGADFDPLKWYGEDPLPQMGRVDSLRDEFDFKLAAVARDAGIPVLGICRGMQLIGVAYGGSLYQDIPTQVTPFADTAASGIVFHNQSDFPDTTLRHHIRILPDSRLAGMLGATDVEVNSFHHQSVKRVPAGFRAVAWADDGVVEAIEPDGSDAAFSNFLGVQFHPEKSVAAGDSSFLSIFKSLVQQAER